MALGYAIIELKSNTTNLCQLNVRDTSLDSACTQITIPHQRFNRRKPKNKMSALLCLLSFFSAYFFF